jgi:hypothetical protein
MRVLRAIIQSPALPMGNPRHYLDKCCGVALETIGYYGARTVTQTLQQLPKEPLRRFLVPLSLNQDVEDLAALIDRTPQIDQGAIHFAKDFVQVPSVAPLRQSRAKPAGILGTKLERPKADGFMRHFNTTG